MEAGKGCIIAGGVSPHCDGNTTRRVCHVGGKFKSIATTNEMESFYILRFLLHLFLFTWCVIVDGFGLQHPHRHRLKVVMDGLLLCDGSSLEAYWGWMVSMKLPDERVSRQVLGESYILQLHRDWWAQGEGGGKREVPERSRARTNNDDDSRIDRRRPTTTTTRMMMILMMTKPPRGCEFYTNIYTKHDIRLQRGPPRIFKLVAHAPSPSNVPFINFAHNSYGCVATRKHCRRMEL